MMRWLTVCLSFLVSISQAQDMDSWESIKDKTWTTFDTFAGRGLTFYDDQSGNKKCIIQDYGSGMPIISSEVYDVSLKADSILFYHKELGYRENLNLYILTTDTLISEYRGFIYLLEFRMVSVFTRTRELISLDSLKTGRHNYTYGKVLE